MYTKLCERLGIDFPIFAFTHCRDVAAAVTNAGGFGVLGAAGFNADQLRIELDWLDKHVHGRPYGVDVIIPNRYYGQEEKDRDKLLAIVQAAVPRANRDFAEQLLDAHGVPRLPDGETVPDRLSMTEATNAPLVDIALEHPNVKLIANALGTPPPDIIQKIKDSGRLVGALCGAPKHARAHVEAGLDFIVAQGTEGGGHCGEIGSSVLWPDVVDIAGDIPVLAAGGVASGRQMYAALSLGAQGVWCGSLWLTTVESNANSLMREKLIAAESSDTVRSKSVTGKFARMLRSKWTDAWGAGNNPVPAGPPMQAMSVANAMERMRRYPEKSGDVMFVPVGQGVGRMTREISAKDIVAEMVNDYIETHEKMSALMPAAE